MQSVAQMVVAQMVGAQQVGAHRGASGSLRVVPWAALHRGDLVLDAGVRELDRREDPLGLEPHGTSLALVLETDDRREWWLLAEHRDGTTATVSTLAGSRFTSFDRWVDHQVASAGGEQPGPAVRFTAAGSLEVAGPNATLLAQRSGTALGPAFASPGARTAVAKVQHEGVVWFVLAREVGGVTDSVPTISDATTIDEFLDEARRWYDVPRGPEGPRT